MPAFQKYNPNPATKFFVTVLLGMGLLYQMNNLFNLLTVLVFVLFFVLNGRAVTGLRVLLVYLPLMFLMDLGDISHWNGVLKLFVSLFIVVKMFFLPFLSGKFFIATSDVGSIITVMDRVHIPQSLSIPIAVMFRFFPAYREESANIKMAMKMRGITRKNPFRYLEYVTVPLLIASSNIAEDISKSAETKCIANPGKKTRYTEVRFRTADAVFLLLILGIQLGGRFYG